MYEANQSNETPEAALGMEPETPVPPALAFRIKLETVTPRVFVTPILIALNVLVYVAMAVKGVHPMEPNTQDLLRWGADFGPLTVTEAQWWRILTSTFVHIGLIHIASNMFVLWQAGPFVERLLGNVGFLVAYLIAGLAGSFVSLAWNPYVVSAGASGAIFGVYGALIGFLVKGRNSVPTQVLTPLASSAFTFLAYNLFYGFANSGTDMAAHFGGLVAGFLCGLAMSVPITDLPLPRRGFRNAVSALGAGALFMGVAAELPKPVDLPSELQKFGVVEKKVIDAFDAASSGARSGQLADQQFAENVEKNVLPAWREEHGRLKRLTGMPPRQQRLIATLVKYMDAREQGWSLLAKGLRAQDIRIVEAGNAKQAEAASVLKEMKDGQ